jgi:hypothetical protein
MKKIPFVFINNYYDDTSSPYAEPIIKGGSQVFLSSDTILFVTRSQIKDEDKTLAGWSFNYSAMKSRTVKEKSKFRIEVTYEGGIDVNSGLFDAAMDAGLVVAPKQGWYQILLSGMKTDKLVRRKDIEGNQKFFDALVKNDEFKNYIHEKYALETGDMFREDAAHAETPVEVDPETGEILS